MARRAMILDANDGAGKQTEINACLWADVPAARQRFYANAGAASRFLDATAQELQDLRDGKVAEKVVLVVRAPGATTATVRAAIEAEQTAWQAYVTAFNPWSRYGTNWDGVSTWTPVGVA